MATFDYAALGRLQSRLQGFVHADPAPLLAQWRVIIEEDNRKGVLAGLDKDGYPMPPVTYRPKPPAMKWGKAKQAKHLKGATSPTHNNLTPAQYRRLSGPPLAPRGIHSRVITNLLTGSGWDSAEGVYFAEGAWFDVVSTKGVPFLEAHFTGAWTGRNHATKLPRRDLRGVRPWGRQQALAALVAWGKSLVSKLAG